MKFHLVLIAALISLPVAEGALLSFEEVRTHDESSEILLLDRAGVLIDSYRLKPNYRKAPWVRLDDFSASVRKLLVEAEDQRFFEHSGVDWFSLGKSAIAYLQGSRARGASTITMQLVSLINPALEHQGRRSLDQKLDQIEAAIELEKSWSKDQILEAYLNLVPLRGEWVGIHSVARFLFKKSPEAMDPVEAALVVAMLPSPNQEWNKISDRACVFLKHVYESQPVVGEKLCEDSRTRKLAGVTSSAPDRLYEHYTHYFVDRLAGSRKRGGLVTTSIDDRLQQRVYQYAKEALTGINKQNVKEIASLVFDLKTGEILSYIGNIQRFSKAEHVDGAQARRQAGSTLKPFFYGLAIQNKKYDLTSTILDEPLQIETSNGAFRPENYDHEFHGWVALATALASSLNIPAVKVVQEVGVDESVTLLKKLGIQGLKPGYIYGPSLALGTVDLTLEELTRAYMGLARQGQGEDSKSFPIDADVAKKITRIISDNVSRSLTFGMTSVLATPYFTGVKTGTSKDMRDNWCVGFSDRYAVGVWVGNFSGEAMQDVSGVSGAAPLWRKIMDDLNSKNPSRVPPVIARISLPEVSDGAGRIAGVARQTLPKIIYPDSGSVLAVDPEIPIDRQRVLLKSTLTESKYKWYLNNELVGALDEPQLWQIARGKMRLEIRDRDQNVMDTVSFLVK